MKKVLVAEDNLANRELVREILQVAGYRVVEASDGNDVFRTIECEQPDLVLLDIQLPHLNGFALIRQLRTDPRFSRLPILAVTAYAMRGDKENVLAAGFDGYITKPIDTAVLPEQIRRHLKDQS